MEKYAVNRLLVFFSQTRIKICQCNSQILQGDEHDAIRNLNFPQHPINFEHLDYKPSIPVFLFLKYQLHPNTKTLNCEGVGVPISDSSA